MEEKMKRLGLCEMNSSELLVRGGSGWKWTDIVEKIRNILEFIGDYLPKLLSGLADGFTRKQLAK